MVDTNQASTAWTGHDLVDVKGDKIGTVEDVRYGDATGRRKWLLVKTGLFGGKKFLVPAGEVRVVNDALVVPYAKERVKDSPAVDQNEALSGDTERKMCAYYGLEYVAAFDSPVEGCVGTETEAGVLSPESSPGPT